MTDRFDEMAGRVQMDLAAFAMPTGTSARRVIADALRAAHEGGVDEAAATIDQLRVELVTAQHEVGEAWFAGGATLADSIRRKITALERLAAPRRGSMTCTIEREDGTVERIHLTRKP